MDMNPELLKQLLAEFEEKQAVTTEEIIEIEKQIEELQARIELSRDRLQEVERDREKVGAMKARYAEGDWSTVLQDLANLKAQAPAPEPAAPKPTIAVAAKGEKPKKGKSSAPDASDNGGGRNVEPQAPPAPPIPPPPPQVEPAPEPQAPIAPAPLAPPAPPPLAPTMEMDMPQTLPTPGAPAAPAGEGLFSFSQATQEQAGDLAWAPSPAMSWDSVNAQSFPPTETGEPQPPAGFPTPDGNNPFLESAAKLGIPNPQSFGQQPLQPQPPQPPQGFAPPGAMMDGGGGPAAPTAPMTPAALAGLSAGSYGNPDVLSTAFDEEFDIAAALRGENEPGGEKEEGDVKKINDALRGLFS